MLSADEFEHLMRADHLPRPLPPVELSSDYVERWRHRVRIARELADEALRELVEWPANKLGKHRARAEFWRQYAELYALFRVRDALQSALRAQPADPSRCSDCGASLVHRRLGEYACPECHPDLVQGWYDEIDELEQ
jgi:hypothetical protein